MEHGLSSWTLEQIDERIPPSGCRQNTNPPCKKGSEPADGMTHDRGEVNLIRCTCAR